MEIRLEDFQTPTPEVIAGWRSWRKGRRCGALRSRWTMWSEVREWAPGYTADRLESGMPCSVLPQLLDQGAEYAV